MSSASNQTQKNYPLPAPGGTDHRGGFWRGAGGVIIYEKSMTRKILILKGEAVVYIDWGNVHGWEKSLKREIDIAYLVTHLKTYPQIDDIRLYAGKDIHPKSAAFLEYAGRAGCIVVSKSSPRFLEGRD